MKITSASTTRASKYWRVEIHSSEGVTGTAPLARAPHEPFATLTNELLIGEDPRAVSAHWQTLARANEQSDRALNAEVAALDIALWDLKSRLNREPLWRTLGGLRPRVNVHIRVPTAARNEADLHRWCERAIQDGVRGVVLNTTTDNEADTSTLAMLADSLGRRADRAYMIDANERWTPKEAIRNLTAIERAVDLNWVEAPTNRYDFLGLKRIVDGVRSAVCSGGRLSCATEFLPHLHHRSLNVVQLDVARVGITAALQIAEAAYGFELPIALTASVGNLHAHVASALSYCASMEWSASDVMSDVRLENGWAIAGDAIGHGMTFDTDHAEPQG